MPTPFLSSEEYDERAHQHYNEGQYEEALEVLREGLSLYPNAVELHIGVGYARLAREEFAWARKSFEHATVLDPDHEDALAGLGETLLRFGQVQDAVRYFRRLIDLGYQDDVDIVLQAGRALLASDLNDEAREFFELALKEAPGNAEALSNLAYVLHRLGDEDGAIAKLRRALKEDHELVEARIYLANILYDRNELAEALRHLERTSPEDHWHDIGIWRMIELKKSLQKATEGDDELRIWEERLAEITEETDDIDEMLAEIEAKVAEESHQDVQGQLELFGALLSSLAEQGSQGRAPHRVLTPEGRQFDGSWDEIVRDMRDATRPYAGCTMQEFMTVEARRVQSDKGIDIPTHDAESFIRASANAGLLRIVR